MNDGVDPAYAARLGTILGQYRKKVCLVVREDRKTLIAELVAELVNVHAAEYFNKLSDVDQVCDFIARIGEIWFWILPHCASICSEQGDDEVIAECFEAELSIWRAEGWRKVDTLSRREKAAKQCLSEASPHSPRDIIQSWMKGRALKTDAAARSLAISPTVLHALKRGTALKEGRCAVDKVRLVADRIGCKPRDLDSQYPDDAHENVSSLPLA